MTGRRTSLCILHHANGASSVDDENLALLHQRTNGFRSSDGVVLAKDLGLEGRVNGLLGRFGIHSIDDSVQAETSMGVLAPALKGDRVIGSPGGVIDQLGIRVIRFVGVIIVRHGVAFDEWPYKRSKFEHKQRNRKGKKHKSL